MFEVEFFFLIWYIVEWSESHWVVSNPLRSHGLYIFSSLDQNTGVHYHSLLQGIFPSQGWNPGLPHCGRILYCVSHQGSPNTTSWLIFTECWQSVKNFLSWRAYIHMHISQWLIHSYHYSQMGFSHMCKVCDRCSCVYTCVHIHVYIYAQFMCECGCVSPCTARAEINSKGPGVTEPGLYFNFAHTLILIQQVIIEDRILSFLFSKNRVLSSTIICWIKIW